LAIKYAGAAYLLYIAWESWNDTDLTRTNKASTQGWDAFRKGALTNTSELTARIAAPVSGR
jgi:threonine/homoserine/homoserine lactone efflux protein